MDARKAAERLETVTAVAVCSLLAVNIADILLGVFARYLLKSSLAWTEEVARYTLVWFVMVGASCAFRHGDHMAIDFLVPSFPVPLRRLAGVLRFAIALFVLVFLVFYGAKNVSGLWEMRTMALGIPKAIVLMAVPAGMGLLLAQHLLWILYREREE
jgi:TRAP-type C4-dicarboxylate transport system permease small subunit